MTTSCVAIASRRPSKTFEQIETKNKEHLYLLSLPYHLGIGAAITAGVAALTEKHGQTSNLRQVLSQ